MATIENLKHFAAVVENSGVIRAAGKIYVSASSLTRSIQIIEQEIGRPLFDRVGRSMRLNQEGQIFHEKASELLDQFSSLLRQKPADKGLNGIYRIGASHFLCAHMAGPTVNEISKLHPGAVFEVHSSDTSALLKKIQHGEIDLGFVFSPIATEVLQFEPILHGQMRLCGGKNHPLASLKFTELRKRIQEFQAIIHRPADSVERCDNHPMFKKFGIRPRIQMYWDSDDFAVSVLMGNEHWSLLPDIVIESRPQLKAFDHPKDWEAPYIIGLIWNKNRPVSDLREAISHYIMGRSKT